MTTHLLQLGAPVTNGLRTKDSRRPGPADAPPAVMATSGVSDSSASAIGALCVAVDHAWIAGEPELMRLLVLRLAEQTPECLHRRLISVAEACQVDPMRAGALWDALKGHVYCDDET